MPADRPTLLLPYDAPANPYRRLLLYTVRRMAARGVNDAHAAHAIFTGFGLSYRCPLVLLRAFVAEVARVSAITLKIAPCCCARMTDHEQRLVDAIAAASAAPQTAHHLLCGLLQVRSCLGAASGAEAVGTAFADLGMPLG